MSKFCGKCGSKLDEITGLCPQCDKETIIQKEINKNRKKAKHKSIIRISIIVVAVVFVAAIAFFSLDYFDVIPTQISESLGIKSSGSFNIESDKAFVFTSDDKENVVNFYCEPEIKFSSLELYCENPDTHLSDFSDNDKDNKETFFVASANIKENTNKTLKYHAVLKDGLRYYVSNTIEIQVKDDWSDDELSAMDNADKEIQTLLSNKNFKNKSIEQRAEEVEKLLKKLSSEENGSLILQDSITFDEGSKIYSYLYSNGCMGCVSVEMNDNSNGMINGGVADTSVKNTLLTSNINNKTSEGKTEKSGDNVDAVIMYDWYKDNDAILDFYKDYQNKWTSDGMKTDLAVNPTVEQYKTQLSGKQLVLIAAHGDRVKSSLNTYSIICTYEECTKEKDKSYKFDLNQHNIIRRNYVDGTVYCISPYFFSTYYGDGSLKNSIVLIDSCLAFGENEEIDYDLASSIPDAGAVVGFHNSVNIFRENNADKTNEAKYTIKGYGPLFMENIVKSLMTSKTIGQSFENAKNLLGETQYEYFQTYYEKADDEDDKEVYPLIIGNSETKLSVSANKHDYVANNYLVMADDKYICSDGNAIYYKNTMFESGKKIVDQTNSGHLMSDGNTVYFSVTNTCDADGNKNEMYLTNGNGSQIYYQDDIYSVNIDGSNLEKVFSADHEIFFVGYYKGCIYYVDQAFENGTLQKYDTKSKSKSELAGAENAYRLGNKIYYSTDIVSQNVELIKNNTVNAMDLDTEKITQVATESTLNGSVLADDKLHFISFKYKYDAKSNKSKVYDQYIYTIDKNGTVKNSNKVPDATLPATIVGENTVIYTDSVDLSNKKYYIYNLKNGKKAQIDSKDFTFMSFPIDLVNSNDVYYVGFLGNPSVNSNLVGVGKVTENGSTPCEIDGSEYVNIETIRYCFVDGVFIDGNFKYYELD